MAIVSFWSSKKKETNQSISIISSAIQMGIDRNLKILLIDTNFSDNTYDKCFSYEETDEFVKTLNKGKLDISSGVEGLILAVTSNKATPEIVRNYTKPILQGRLDLLSGLSTTNIELYKNSYIHYPAIIEEANKYYDIIMVDLDKGYGDKVVTKILAMSDLIVVTFDQDKELILDFEKLWGNDPLFSPKERVIPLLTKEDRFSIYNNNNVARQIKMYPGMPSIIYNTQLMEATQRGECARFLIDLNMSSETSRNKLLLDVIMDLNALIIERLEQQKYKGKFNIKPIDEIIKDHIAYMSNIRNVGGEVTVEEEQFLEKMQKEMGVPSNNKNININTTESQEPNKVNIQNQNQNQNLDSQIVEENTYSKFGEDKEFIDEKIEKEQKNTGLKGFFANLFGKKEEINTEEEKLQSEPQLETGLQLDHQLEQQLDQKTDEQIESQSQQMLNQDNNMNIEKELEMKSEEAAKKITQRLGETEVDIAQRISKDTERIILENQKIIEKLEQKSDQVEQENKSGIDFSKIKPLKEEAKDETSLYELDESGAIKKETAEESLQKINEGLKKDKPVTSIDFSKVKPLSEEKEKIANEQYKEMQEKIKDSLLNKEEKEKITKEKEITETENIAQMQNQNINQNENTNINNIEDKEQIENSINNINDDINSRINQVLENQTEIIENNETNTNENMIDNNINLNDNTINNNINENIIDNDADHIDNIGKKENIDNTKNTEEDDLIDNLL